jgi:hypothetical protein
MRFIHNAVFCKVRIWNLFGVYIDQSIREHGDVTGKHLVILSHDIARVTQHMTSQAMHVKYRRRSEIFVEYWLETVKGDLMYKTEVVTLCTICE